VQRGGSEFTGTSDTGTTQRDYEKVLQRAASKLDFSVGEGLYLIPNNMNMFDLAGNYNGFNNKLQVATGGLGLCVNSDVNIEQGLRPTAQDPKKEAPALTPTPTPTRTPTPEGQPKQVPGAPTTRRPATPASDGHEELKAVIVIAAIIGFSAFEYYRWVPPL
jgi:hypothetical protein